MVKSEVKESLAASDSLPAVDYFKKLAAELGMPYQNLINLYLRDCAVQKRRPTIEWPVNPGPARL
jgi:hypothetical protein